MLGYREKFLLQMSGEALEVAAQEVVESPSLEVFKKRVDVALKDVVNGMLVMGWQLALMTLEVLSNLSGSLILYLLL